jgi:hypothetical protein
MTGNWINLPQKRMYLIISAVILLAFFIVFHYLDSDSAVGDTSNVRPGQTQTSSTTASPVQSSALSSDLSSDLDTAPVSGPQNPNSSDNSSVVAQPISPDDSSFSGGPTPLSNPPISNPFAESNGQPKADPVADSSTTTPSTQPPIPQPPLSAPPTTLPDVFSKTGIPPDCSVRLITLTENERPRRIIQVAVRNNVSAIWVKATSGLKEQVQGLPVTNNYAETTLTITDLPVEIFVYGSEFQEATSLGCTTLVNR